MNDSGGASRVSKKSGGVTILLLLLVVCAIGFIGYYGFVETGTVAPAPAPPRATPLSRP